MFFKFNVGKPNPYQTVRTLQKDKLKKTIDKLLVDNVPKIPSSKRDRFDSTFNRECEEALAAHIVDI